MLVGISGEDVPGMKAAGVDLNEFALHGANMYLDMIFRDGFYHADPHPGNLMMLPGGVVGVLDCGMVGRLDETMRDEVESLLSSIINKDAVELTDCVMRLGSVPPELDRDALRAEISNFVSEYASRTLRDFNLSGALKQMTDIIRRYHIMLPSTLALMLKTLVMLEGTSRQLNPNFNLAELIEPYQLKVLKHRLSLDRGAAQGVSHVPRLGPTDRHLAARHRRNIAAAALTAPLRCAMKPIGWNGPSIAWCSA